MTRPIPSPPGRRLRTVLPLVLACLLGGCLQRNPVPAGRPLAPESSRKLAPFVHYEDGPVLFVGVDGRAAQYAKDQRIFPLGIGLANQSRTPLTFRLESFILETADGVQYPVVSLDEYARDYGRSRSDARLAEHFREILNQRFRNYRFTPWRAFPVRGENVTAPAVLELGRLFWTHTYLYFPVPETGLHGKSFTLLVRADPIPEPFVVRFTLE